MTHNDLPEVLHLDNGLKILLVQREYSPLNAVLFSSLAGNCHEPLPGISHLLEHVMFRNSKNNTIKDIMIALESAGATVNALTSREYMGINLTIPPHNTHICLQLMRKILDNRFSVEEVEREKQVVQLEIEGSEDREGHLWDMFYRLLWPGHPIGMPITGTVDDVSSIDFETLRQFRRNVMCASNSLLTVCGSFDRDRLLKQIIRTFSAIEKGKSLRLRENPGTQACCAGESHIDKDISGLYIITGAWAPSLSEKARYHFRLFDKIMGAGIGARLYQAVRDAKSLAYALSSVYFPLKAGGFFAVRGIINPGRKAEFLQSIREECLKVSSAETDLQRDLRRGKGIYESTLRQSFETTLSTARIYTIEELLGTLTTAQDSLRTIKSITEDSLKRTVSPYMAAYPTLVVSMGRSIT